MARKLSVAEKLVAELKNTDLSMKDRSMLISAILDKFAAIPLRDIIYLSEDNNIFVNDKKVSREQQIILRQSAEALASSSTFKLICQQVLYASFVNSSKAPITDDLVLYKGALWWGQQVDKYLKLLTSEVRNGNLPSED